MDKKKKFALFTDEEWIKGLTSTPIDEELHRYFFKIKCASMLQYVSHIIFKSDDFREIIGEFYELIAKNDWRILRMFRGEKDSTLYNYLTRCTVNHFISKQKKDPLFKRMLFYSFEMPEIIDEVENIADIDEPLNSTAVLEAFNQLQPRDKNILRILVLDGKNSMDAVEEIWPYVNSKHDWRDLPASRVQSTISMIKHRALMRLSYNTTDIMRS